MHLFMLQIFFFCCTYDSIGKRMWEMLFQACSDTKHLILFVALHGNNLLYCRCSLGQCACFIKYNVLCLGQCFKIIGSFYKNPLTACSSDSCKETKGNADNESTWTTDN